MCKICTLVLADHLLGSRRPPLKRYLQELEELDHRCSQGAGYIYLYIYPLLVYHILPPSVKFINKKNERTFVRPIGMDPPLLWETLVPRLWPYTEQKGAG